MNDRTRAALANMRRVRGMLKNALEGIEPERWCWQPTAGINHVAWQVGHLAVAQHALCLKRVRGDSPADARFLPDDYYQRFGRGSKPAAGAGANPSPEELLKVLDAVEECVQTEVAEKSDEQLDTPLDPPHPMFSTVLGGVEFAAMHEAMHVGQITLLRRLMGFEVKW